MTEPQSPLRRLRALLANYDFEFAELLTGAAALGWAIWLLNPLWHTFAGAPYAAMARVAPEEAWGILMAILGIVQLHGLLRGRWPLRRAGSLALAMVWAFIGAMFIAAAISNTGSVIYPLLSLASLWSYWRMRIRA